MVVVLARAGELEPLEPLLKELIHHTALDIKDEGRVFESYSFCVTFPHDNISVEPPTATEIDSHFKRLKRIKEKHLRS